MNSQLKAILLVKKQTTLNKARKKRHAHHTRAVKQNAPYKLSFFEKAHLAETFSTLP